MVSVRDSQEKGAEASLSPPRAEMRQGILAQRIEEKYGLLSGNHRLGISVVSVGEIEAAVLKAGYGEKRIARLRAFIDALTKFGIDFEEMIRFVRDSTLSSK